MNTYLVEGAAVEEGRPHKEFEFQPRKFQSEFINWVENGDEKVVTLEAPTGSGKTAAFKYLVKNRNQSLLVYPTNSLIQDQKSVFEDTELEVKLITGETLTESGIERRDELLAHARRGGYDAIITNPDILQAIIQGQYVDYNSKLLEFFNQFDAIVYDEYHFYDQFAASGIMLQSKLAVERGNAQVVFASATGNDIPNIIGNLFELKTKEILATPIPPEQGSKFRHQIELKTDSKQMISRKEELAVELSEYVKSDHSRAAVIFNSAKHSNSFYKYLIENEETFPRVAKNVEKDNGYDTKGTVSLSDEFSILITTSKGEVGLDYDIDRLYMDCPYNASSFIQRVGRAARHQPATVDVYNIGSLPWSDKITYEQFVKNSYKTLRNNNFSRDNLSELIGLRAAYAMHSRTQDSSSGYNEELKKDFGTVPHYEKWRQFIQSVERALEKDRGLRKPPSEYQSLLRIASSSLSCLNTLRGRNASVKVKYPRGNITDVTQYSLLSTLSQYHTRVDDNGTLSVDPEKEPISVLLDIQGIDSKQKFENYSDLKDIHNQMKTTLDTLDERWFNGDSVHKSQLKQFLDLIGPRNSIVISSVKIGDSELQL